MFPLCKHLHKVFSIVAIQQPESAPAVEKVEPDFFTVENEMTFFEETGQNVSRQEGNMMQRIQKIREVMKEFDDKYLDNSPVKKHMLPRIENTLLDLQAQCKLLCEDPVPVAAAAMDVKTQTAPNEKLKKQLKPFVKKSRKKKKTGLQRAFGQSAVEIKDFLLQDPNHNIDSDLASVSEEHSHYVGEIEPNQTDPNVVTKDHAISNPLDIVIDYQGIKVSSLHLKALDTSTIDARELQGLLQSDSKFVHGWLYDEVVNIFFKMLGNETVFACDSTVAVRLYMGNLQFKNFPSQLSSKAVILFPGNLTGDHWVIIAVEVSSCSMWFYNPLSSHGSLLTQCDKKFLGAVALILKNVFPSVKSWYVKRHFDVQKDHVSCGVHICWFGYCWSTKSNVSPLEDVTQFRKSMYNTIVSLID